MSPDYIQCFLKHIGEGTQLFHNTGDLKDSPEGKASLGICACAKEMLERALEAKALADIFTAVDPKSQSAILPIIAVRMNEIITSTKWTLSLYNDHSESTETQAQQLQRDTERFIRSIEGARSLAVLTLSAGGK